MTTMLCQRCEQRTVLGNKRHCAPCQLDIFKERQKRHRNLGPTYATKYPDAAEALPVGGKTAYRDTPCKPALWGCDNGLAESEWLRLRRVAASIAFNEHDLQPADVDDVLQDLYISIRAKGDVVSINWVRTVIRGSVIRLRRERACIVSLDEVLSTDPDGLTYGGLLVGSSFA